MSKPLDAKEIADGLRALPGWVHEDDHLTKTFEFHHFREAFSFLTRVAFEAETLGHHPEIFNVYKTVKLSLNTHDAGGKVTMKDVELARVIEQFNWLGKA